MAAKEEINYFENNLGNDLNMNDKDFDEFILKKIINISDEIWKKKSGKENLEFDNLFSGNVGIAYMFWHLSQQTTLFSDQDCDKYLSRARTLILKTLNLIENKERQKSDSFLFGNSGVHLIAALILNSCNEYELRDKYLDLLVHLCSYYLNIDFDDKMRDTFFEGKAGFVAVALAANHFFGTNIIPVTTLQNIGNYNALIANRSDLPLLFGVDNSLDISRGMSGILLSLLCIPELTRLHPDFEPHLKKVVDYILIKQSADGSFIPDNDPVNWFSGSAGICWLMAKAYRLWSDDKYKQSMVKCGQIIWKRGLSRRGLGLSTGIAGNGFVFLLLYECTSDPKYLLMARQFAKFAFEDTFVQNYSQTENPDSLYEGRSGLVCYLVALLRLEKPRMPLFFDIFAKENVELTEDFATVSEPMSEIISIEDSDQSVSI